MGYGASHDYVHDTIGRFCGKLYNKLKRIVYDELFWVRKRR